MKENVNLKGNYLADQFSYIKIEFKLCPQYSVAESIECSPLNEIEDYLNNLFINIAIFKMHFSLGGDLKSSFTQRKTIDDKLYFRLSSKSNQICNIFVRETNLIESGTYGMSENKKTILDVRKTYEKS